jgi:GntR family transcriptional regulator of arabinose operon
MKSILIQSEPETLRRTKHAVLTEQLRNLATTLQPGDRLPAQDELMRRYQVSDRTVLRSLEDLQREGYIVRRRGRGTFVTDPRERNVVAASPQSVTDSRTITVLAPHFFAASYLRLCADMLSREAETMGLSLMCQVAHAYAAPASLSAIEQMHPRGFVLLGYPMADVAAGLIARGHRAVVLGTPPVDTDPIVPCVFADHDLGGYLAARHLIDWGHRRLAFAYDGQMRYPYARHPRCVGHQRALDEALGAGDLVSNVILDEETLVSWRQDGGLAKAYFRRPDAPSGICVWNDSVAISLLGILYRAGLRVPEDVSLIGFDALPEGEDSIPPLTTIDQHVGWQIQAVLRLLNRVTPPPPQGVVTLPELKQRASCGPPPVL